MSMSVCAGIKRRLTALESLTADGGKPIQCSWLKDKFGVAWQIVPEALPRMLHDEEIP